MNTQSELIPSFYTEYSAFTASTARYPVTQEKPYLALGLADETADELLSAFQRCSTVDMFLELGDAQWYACRLCFAFGFDFAQVVADAKVARGEMPLLDLSEAILSLILTAGKVAGRVKKHARDAHTWDNIQEGDFEHVLYGHLVRFVAVSLLVIDGLWKRDPAIGNYDACLRANVSKLGGRLTRDTIHGDGDYR